jgi:hypothetical protein
MTSPHPPLPGDERRHPAANTEEWLFVAWRVHPPLGLVSGYRITAGVGWYWAALARAATPLLHVADWHVPLRSDPLLVKSEGLWAEHTCDAPLEQWTVANETYAAALDDPAEALGRAYGMPTALSWDLEWYATDAARWIADDGSETARAYVQSGVVHGDIEIGGEDPERLAEVPAQRWHRWGAAVGPLRIPDAYAHTGLRAPFAFPDGTVADWVLTPDGWRDRSS